MTSIPWHLTGASAQIAIATDAFDRIKFPLERLTFPAPPTLRWRNLNDGSEWWVDSRRAGIRGHEGHHAPRGKPDSLVGEFKGRRWTMGAIDMGSGDIWIDQSLEAEPAVAMATIGAELAHAVDAFLPMTDAQRDALMELWNLPGTTWWEVADYGAEYYRLGGEAFMHEFVAAYSDLDFGDTGAFAHNAGVEPRDVRRILGIERTDAAIFDRYGTSKIYHKRSHYKRPGITTIYLEGLRPCRICKP